MTEMYQVLYANKTGLFLLINATCGITPPLTILCSSPFNDRCELKKLSSLNDCFQMILKENPQMTEKDLGKHFNLSQQHINRLISQKNCFPENPEKIKKLLKFFDLN